MPTHMNTWMIGKNSMKHHEDDFYSDLNMEGITDADYKHTKEFAKILK